MFRWFKNFGGKTASYFRGVIREGKRVRWPSRKDMFENSAIVIVFTGFFGLFLTICFPIAQAILEAINYL